MDHLKRPIGRPSKYDPDFCEIVRDTMAAGYSKTAAAGVLGISRDTLLEWSKQYPEFSGAVKDGAAGRVLKLEGDLLEAKDGPTVTSRIFALKNADPDEWRDRREHEVSGPGGGPMQLETIAQDAESFARRMASLQAGVAGEGDGEPESGGSG